MDEVFRVLQTPTFRERKSAKRGSVAALERIAEMR
jgi:hypothetical protein